MKKQLLISTLCACAALSGMAEEGITIMNQQSAATVQTQAQGTVPVGVMVDQGDSQSAQQAFNKLKTDLHLDVSQSILGPLCVINGNGYIGRPIGPRPGRPGGDDISGNLEDLLDRKLSGLWSNGSFAKMRPSFPTSTCGYGVIRRPVKPGSSDDDGVMSLEDLIRGTTKGGGGGSSFVASGSDGPLLSSPSGKGVAGDVNNDGLLSIDDVTSMIDRLANGWDGGSIADVADLIDLLNEVR